MFVFVDIVRAIATLLITNSHFAPIYTIDAFAVGGALGNSLFFLITGFCLFNCKGKFKPWYFKRLIRLYVPLVIIAPFYLYQCDSPFFAFFFSFVMPVNYWFIVALCLLYPIYFLALNCSFRNKKYVLLLIILILYSVIYLFLDKTTFVVETAGIYGIRFSYIFSFLLMLIGAYIRKNIGEIRRRIKSRKKIVIIAFFVFLVTYFSFLVAMKRKPALCAFQFIETILCSLTTITLVSIILLLENFWVKIKDNAFIRCVRFLGNTTLEIYLVQFPLIKYIGSLNILSAYKFVFAVSAILICAILLRRISRIVVEIISSCGSKKSVSPK